MNQQDHYNNWMNARSQLVQDSTFSRTIYHVIDELLRPDGSLADKERMIGSGFEHMVIGYQGSTQGHYAIRIPKSVSGAKGFWGKRKATEHLAGLFDHLKHGRKIPSFTGIIEVQGTPTGNFYATLTSDLTQSGQVTDIEEQIDSDYMLVNGEEVYIENNMFVLSQEDDSSLEAYLDSMLVVDLSSRY